MGSENEYLYKRILRLFLKIIQAIGEVILSELRDGATKGTKK